MELIILSFKGLGVRFAALGGIRAVGIEPRAGTALWTHGVALYESALAESFGEIWILARTFALRLRHGSHAAGTVIRRRDGETGELSGFKALDVVERASLAGSKGARWRLPPSGPFPEGVMVCRG